ncbi:hypothetical protein [Limosilactobacillus oris]|uniref:hypothetical protein n=1 Tax=Limosilactobacillus oris TaxID=1632 RepID=UPI00242DB57A|nr:hypothetical protein [Limosilactobacillus oris]
MGLFSSLDDKLAKFDEEELYKKALLSAFRGAETSDSANTDIILHHDLQEIKEELRKLNQK